MGRARTLDLRLPGVILASVLLAMSFGNMGQAFEPDDANNPIVNKFLNASKIQQDAFRGTRMEVDIDAKLPKLKEQGKLRVLKIIPRLGEITYRKLGEFVGDRTVETEVIARYLELKTDAPENAAIAITPDNYHFRRKTIMTIGSSQIYVFELKPKKNVVGLFKGELWLDAATGMPVKVSGTLVKTPSIFLKKVVFVNEFQLQNGVAWPSHIECHVDVRVAGSADLNIHFSNIAQAEEDEKPAELAEAP
jgi:hypothetical protein